MAAGIEPPRAARATGIVGTIKAMPVHATWSRRLPGVTVLAFADRSYHLMLGSGDKPPLAELGWAKWRPNYVRFPRFTKIG
jgi:hypothetical protein